MRYSPKASLCQRNVFPVSFHQLVSSCEEQSVAQGRSGLGIGERAAGSGGHVTMCGGCYFSTVMCNKHLQAYSCTCTDLYLVVGSVMSRALGSMKWTVVFFLVMGGANSQSSVSEYDAQGRIKQLEHTLQATKRGATSVHTRLGFKTRTLYCSTCSSPLRLTPHHSCRTRHPPSPATGWCM